MIVAMAQGDRLRGALWSLPLSALGSKIHGLQVKSASHDKRLRSSAQAKRVACPNDNLSGHGSTAAEVSASRSATLGSALMALSAIRVPESFPLRRCSPASGSVPEMGQHDAVSLTAAALTSGGSGDGDTCWKMEEGEASAGLWPKEVWVEPHAGAVRNGPCSSAKL